MLTVLLFFFLILFLVLYSLGKGLDIADEAWRNRKPKKYFVDDGSCPYCGSMEHDKTYHVPRQS